MSDNKRYMVFVSSTYEDLKVARSKAFETILNLDHFPAGMESFPPADEQQWEFIKSVIRQCDYYILIIGGRYGSIDSDGMSYTEKEYDFAVEQQIPVIVLAHSDPEKLKERFPEEKEDAVAKLKEFREKVSSGRIIKLWSDQNEVGGLVAAGLVWAIKSSPRTGWVRGDQIAETSALTDLNKLHKENAELRVRIAELISVSQVPVDEIAFGDDEVIVEGTFVDSRSNGRRKWKLVTSWDQVWKSIGPNLIENKHDQSVRNILKRELFDISDNGYRLGQDIKIDNKDFNQIKIQLSSLGMVELKEAPMQSGGIGLFWKITEKGLSYLHSISVQRRKADTESPA